ncbi:hypothetical protein DPEC_G00209480 [Dallia pectoralis]|uniref:Uncharacterized protein n=1 Tax=Dallia pectoralis TaxID=75939 RepID=A0ACC2G566_DALPE|nr:hypothetical protein DPEC_G00209480 [Dallia pectoralis]
MGGVEDVSDNTIGHRRFAQLRPDLFLHRQNPVVRPGLPISSKAVLLRCLEVALETRQGNNVGVLLRLIGRWNSKTCKNRDTSTRRTSARPLSPPNLGSRMRKRKDKAISPQLHTATLVQPLDGDAAAGSGAYSPLRVLLIPVSEIGTIDNTGKVTWFKC